MTAWERRRASAVGEVFAEVARAVGVDPHGPWLVGGSVRRELMGLPQEADFDVACRSPAQLEAVRTCLKQRRFVEVREHPAFVELMCAGVTVQLLKCTASTVEAVLDEFDFTICMAGYDGQDFVLGPMTKAHLAAKCLVLNKLTYGPQTLVRIGKYARQGYDLRHEDARFILQQAAANPACVDATFWVYTPERSTSA